MSDELDVSVFFSDGYILKNAAHIINAETEEAVMIFTEDTITINFMAKNKSTIHDFKFLAEELSGYSYNPDLNPDGTVPDRYVVGFKTQEFNRNMRVSKKDGIAMFVQKKFRDKLIVRHIKNATRSESQTEAYVTIIDVEDSTYKVKSNIENEIPHIRILPKEFSDVCIQCSNLKCAFMRIEKIGGDREGIKVEGVTHSGAVACESNFFSSRVVNRRSKVGIAPEYITQCVLLSSGLSTRRYRIVSDSTKFKLNGHTVKTLSKINNMSTSKIKIFLTEGEPLKITCEMGNIGTYSLYSTETEQK